MQKWEYFHITPYVKTQKWVFDYKGNTRNIEDIWSVLNELGAQVWELVTAVPFIRSEDDLPRRHLVYTYSSYYILYFKRPKS
jgi:MoaA/NifB/PqqE/SkfB family radical SAM enzyme